MITVTAAIIEKEGRILAARKKEGLHLAGYWEFPGGKLEEGETPEECLRRELYEEFGISCTVEQFVANSIYTYSDTTICLKGYCVKHTGGNFTLTDHDEVCWLTVDELGSLNWAPADIPLVAAVMNNHITQRTLYYYNHKAEEYFRETIDIDMAPIRHTFIRLLPPKAHILDVGCGSGRDSRAFLHHGFTVTAIEPSPKLAHLSSTLLDQQVVVKKAQDIKEQEQYDGIWACASLVHIPDQELPETMKILANALKANGILYMSLKTNTHRHWDSRGRYYNDASHESISALLTEIPSMEIVEKYESSSKLRSTPCHWSNLLIRKTA